MICPECRQGDHAHCYDTKHPAQDYRGCACQHHPAPDNAPETTEVGRAGR